MKTKILLAFLIIVIAIIIIFICFFLWGRVNYNTEVSDISWPQGPVLMVVQTGITNDYLANYVLSSDGEQRYLFGDNVVYEFVSPKRILLSGDLLNNKNVDLSNLYYIDDTGIIPIKNDFNSVFKEISLSPKQGYLYYEVNDKYCISEFDSDSLGECINLKEELSEWSSERYLFHKEWLAEEDKLVVMVRDREEHYEIPGEDPENMPPQRIQKEMGRYVYDPNINEFEEIFLEELIALKYKGVFLEDGEKDLIQIFKGDKYKLIYDYKNETLGIEEVEANKKAKLIDVPYQDKMPLFDVFYY